MKIYMTAVLFTVICAAIAVGEDRLPKPPELKVLEKFVGTWDCQEVARPAIWTPIEKRSSSLEVNKMVLDGWYLQGRSQTPTGTTQALLMNTYDPSQKKYRIWKYTAGGPPTEYSGQWDEPSQTLTIEENTGGIVLKATFHLIDADHREYHVIARDGEGKVYLDIDGKVTRRKQ